MWNYIFLFGGIIVLAVFLALYFHYRDKNVSLSKIFVVCAYVGLTVLIFSGGNLIQPFLVALIPSVGSYIVLGLQVIAFLVGAWFLVRPAFSRKQEDVDQIKTITSHGTRTVTPGSTTQKKKKKNNSMKAQMGTSKKRRLPRR